MPFFETDDYTRITNEIFLETLFGPDWPRVKVVHFSGDPEGQPRSSWKGYPAGDMLRTQHGHLNTYFSVSVQEGEARSLGGFEKICVIVLDDVGTKVDLAAAEALLGCPPTYVLETSPGNCQAGWKVEPITSREWAQGLVVALYEALGQRGDNLKNLVGLMRLPFGVNAKAKLKTPWRVKMRVWNPHIIIRSLDWPAIETRIGGVRPVTGGVSGSGPSRDMPDPAEVESDGLLQAFRMLGMVQSTLRRMTFGWGFDVDCPWIGEHSERAGEGASYVPIQGRFHCHHGHCQDRTAADVRVRLDELLREADAGVSTAALDFDDDLPPPEPEPARDEPEVSETELGAYPPTEYGAAQAFADRYRDQLRFDHARGAWLRWQGGRWEQDACEYAYRVICDFAQAFGRAHMGLKGTGSARYAAAVHRIVRAHPSLASDGTTWDLDPWRVGAPGCEVNLKTGRVEQPNPAHGITKQVRVAPARMPTPIWDRFLWQLTGGDPEAIEFLQAWCGYCLTGDTNEEKFVFLWGLGGNGKTTFVETIVAILGDYATTASADTFLRRKFDAHPEEVARLAGVRLVAASEIEDGRSFNVARLKSFTGGDRLVGRFMRQDSFVFLPQFKLMIDANNKPRLSETGDAITRRMYVLPCTYKPSVVDPTLREKLRVEQPGILQWMIEGELRRREAGGLAALIPATAAMATEEYLAEQDHLACWATERCVFGDDLTMNIGDAYDDYRAWLYQQGVHKDFSRIAFSRLFLERFKTCTRGRTAHARLFEGVSLATQDVAF